MPYDQEDQPSVPVKEMGLFSLIAKNIALMKEKAGKAGERLSINQIDSFTNLSYLKK